MPRAAWFLLALALALHTARARADERTPAEVDARYSAIESALARGESRSRLWWNGWALGYGGLTVAQGGIALFAKDKGTRVDAVVGGAGSLLGFAGVLTTSRAAFTARDTLAEMDASTPEARALRLRKAEELLEEAADAERLQKSIWAHLATTTVNLTGTFVLWIGYKRYQSGWLNLLASTAVGELQIITAPTDAVDAWDDYRAGRLRKRSSAPRAAWSVAPVPWGLELSASF